MRINGAIGVASIMRFPLPGPTAVMGRMPAGCVATRPGGVHVLQLPRNMFAAAPVDADLPSIRARIEIPTRTILKVVLAILAVYLAVRLSSVLLDIFIAVLFTAALDPI